MRFEWDPAKAASNARKHGVTFEQAVQAMSDPKALELLDQAANEERWRLIGRSEAGLLVVVYTERGRNVRIISARPANTRERKAYLEQD